MEPYDVVTYGHPALRKKAQLVERVTPELRKLARDMLDTMYAHNGAGLAAQQIGRTESLCVIDVSIRETPDEPTAPPENPGVPMPLVMFNPRIVEMDGKQTGQEGCLSFPEIFVNISRARNVTAVFLNQNGVESTVRATGLLARAIQHELDHLNAVLIVDRMSPVQKVANAGKLKRLKKNAVA